jgi:hypothetical protein
MTLDARKINIINWISQLHDEKTVARLEEFQSQQDWWLTIRDAERAAIEEGSLQADKGDTKLNEDVFEKYQKWL